MEFEDDDEEFVWEPPPDPSLRTWRHPSEIAAAARAAEAPPPRKRQVPLALANRGGLALALAAVVSAPLLYFSLQAAPPVRVDVAPAASDDFDNGTPDLEELTTTSTRPTTMAPSEGEPPPEAEAGISSAVTTTPAPTTSRPDQTDSPPPPTESSEIQTSIQQPDLAAFPTNCQPQPSGFGGFLITERGQRPGFVNPDGPAAATTLAGEVFSGTAPGPFVDNLNPLPSARSLPIGVYGITNKKDLGAPRHLSQYLAVNGMIFTSATAISDAKFLVLNTGRHWFSVAITSADLTQDIAALDAEVDEQGAIRQAITTWQTPASAPRTGSYPVKLASGADQGKVLGDGPIAFTPDCRPIFRGMATNLTNQENYPGDALLHNEEVVGMVTQSTSYLATATPISRILQFGEAAYQWGLPTNRWIGVATSSAPGSGLEVSLLAYPGPGSNAGLKVGDELVAAENTALAHPAQLIDLIRGSDVGDTITLVYQRDGTYHRTEITVSQYRP